MPSRTDVKKALSLIQRRAEYEYFFSKLDSPGWIDPLIDEGRFKTPPPLIREGDYIKFPNWPESQYLVRVAAQAPNSAARALAQIPLNDNERVHVDLVKIALHVEPGAAAAWARKETAWLAQQRWLYLLLPEEIAKFAIYLADNGYGAEAIGLIHAAFEPQPDPKYATKQNDQKQWIPPQPTTKFDTWEYARALKPAAQHLVEQLGFLTLKAVADMLAKSIELSQAEKKPEDYNDYSFIWRSTIEESNAHHNDVRDILIDVVRDASVYMAGTEKCFDIISFLEGYKWDVFRRIALHIIRVAYPSDLSLVLPRVVSHEAFEEPAIFHEYVMLLQGVFGKLPPMAQREVLSWIEQAKEHEAIKAPHRNLDGQEMTDEEAIVRIEQWQRDRLSPIQHDLPVEWKIRFEELTQKYGSPQFDMVQHRITVGFRGEISPWTTDDLKVLSGAEIRKLLLEWGPEEGFDRPTRAGAAQSLEGLDDDFFEQESINAQEWLHLDSVYITTLLKGFERIARKGGNLEWSAVLGLCASLTTDPENHWTRRTAVNLIIEGLDHSSAPIPAILTKKVWSALYAFLLVERHEDKDAHRISGTDFLTVAINTSLGKILEAIIRYAIWSKTSVNPEVLSSWSLESNLPLVASVLNELCAPSKDIPPDTRAIFGAQFGPLMWLDLGWLKRQTSNLFPSSKDLTIYRRAVWETYLAYNEPYRDAFNMLKLQYEIEVDNIKDSTTPNNTGSETSSRAVEHLMVYYWQGILSLDDKLFTTLFRRASLNLRKHAIDFIGRSLHRDEELPSTIALRLQDFINWRIATAQATTKMAERRTLADELQHYGWWFSSEKFEANWTLERLVSILRLGVTVEPDHMVVEQLTLLTELFPEQVSEAIRLMVENSSTSWGVASWLDEARTIVTTLSKSSNPIVREHITRAIESLVAIGHLEFRRLRPQN